MASVKHDLPLCDEQLPKKAKIAESEPSPSAVASNVRVVLNPADCDIDFNVERDGLLGSALYEEGFAYCWSGARANIGITKGKYCFGCKIVSAQPVDMEDTALDMQHVCRVGVSRGDVALRNLGETSNSFGYGGTGKFSISGKFMDYGEKFGVGDTIVCTVDLESRPMATIGFSKNGEWLGVAKEFDGGPRGLGVVGCPVKTLQWESAIFPHILLKNVVVQLKFSIDDGLIPEEGYKPWSDAILDGNAITGPVFSDESEREVIMMVGLPASGKSTWAEKWVNEHPEKRYVLLGTNLALEQMKVPGLLRKHNYSERFDLLMDRATKIFNALLSRASTIHRNFIIDQTNVYKSARKRKLKPFAYYIKIAAVVIPTAEELKSRAEKRFNEMGKQVPAEAVNEMLANFTLPMSKDMPGADEYFDQVWFVDLDRAEAQRSLDEMKRETGINMSYSSSLQHREKAPDQSYIGGSFQNQGIIGSYGTPVSTPAHGSYPLELQHAGINPQPSSFRPSCGNLPMVPPPCGINPDYVQIGNFRQPSPVSRPMNPPYGSFSHHEQNVAMYGQPSPARPVNPLYGSFSYHEQNVAMYGQPSHYSQNVGTYAHAPPPPPLPVQNFETYELPPRPPVQNFGTYELPPLPPPPVQNFGTYELPPLPPPVQNFGTYELPPPPVRLPPHVMDAPGVYPYPPQGC